MKCNDKQSDNKRNQSKNGMLKLDSFKVFFPPFKQKRASRCTKVERKNDHNRAAVIEKCQFVVNILI